MCLPEQGPNLKVYPRVAENKLCRRDPYQPMRKCISIRLKLRRLIVFARAQPKSVTAKYRTARENLQDLVDDKSFIEYGQLALLPNAIVETHLRFVLIPQQMASLPAQQQSTRRFVQMSVPTWLSLSTTTACLPEQGFFHHQKLDRIFEIAERERLPFVMYTEGGGGRPGDTDVKVNIAGLNSTSFSRWAGLTGKVPALQ